MNQPVSPLQYSQTSAQTSTGTAPICATASMNMTAVSTATNGTPAIASPIPPRSDCTSAVTTTPSATPRIAWPASRITFSPRSPASRRPKRNTHAAAASPELYRIAAITTVSTNCTLTSPNWPTSATNQRVTAPA